MKMVVTGAASLNYVSDAGTQSQIMLIKTAAPTYEQLVPVAKHPVFRNLRRHGDLGRTDLI
jgi:hypothetical protein